MLETWLLKIKTFQQKYNTITYFLSNTQISILSLKIAEQIFCQYQAPLFCVYIFSMYKNLYWKKFYRTLMALIPNTARVNLKFKK